MSGTNQGRGRTLGITHNLIRKHSDISVVNVPINRQDVKVSFL